jgi:integrase
MPLNLYRRHGSHCVGGRALHEMTYEADELRRSWKNCSCPIYASGTLGARFKRRNTERNCWDESKDVVRAWEDAGAWDGEAKIERLPEVAAAAPVVPDRRVTIERAVQAFTAEFQNAAVNTQKKYRLLLAKLKAFADNRGYLFIDQWTPIDVREMRFAWAVSPQTAAKDMSTVRGFFEFCLSNEWLSRNPARLVKNPRGRDAADRRNEQKLPFSDDELRRMYDACETKYGKQEIKWSRVIHSQRMEGAYTRYNPRWTGRDLADFISVSVFTGLRIGDTSRFHIDRLRADGSVEISTAKTGTLVLTWVPEWLQERIQARAREFGPYIFGAHKTVDMNVVTDLWRRKLKKLWTLCGPWKEKPTPHRFRHTFARILLERPGVTVRDVSELLGNSEQMVRKHYAAWIPERQQRLTAVLKAAFSEKPKPNVIEMPKTGTN